jgi:FkbM family methyltransferase
VNFANLHGQPYDLILDVGGNIGEIAEAMHNYWPAARLVSFEPIPGAADANRLRAVGRWEVVTTAIGERASSDELLWFCANQHTASTMQAPGTARKQQYGITDEHDVVKVSVQPLDAFLGLAEDRERILIKIDVEGYEGHVLRGARRFLPRATTVICEVQQDPTIFLGSPSPLWVDHELQAHGLAFVGIAGCELSPAGRVMQWDGVWSRDVEPWQASARDRETASKLHDTQ